MTGAPLEGRRALITGGSRGLGFAIAQAFVEAGAKVAVTARDSSELEAAARRIGVDHIAADLVNDHEAEAVVHRAAAILEGLDVVVNNAGVYGPIGLTAEVDWDDWVRTVRVNLLAPVVVARAAIPYMRSHHYGKIIQISGGGATSPLPRFSAYASSKAAVVRFVETLALELRESGVDVNAIAPGPLNTRLLDQVLAAGPGVVGAEFYERATEQHRTGGASVDRAAALAVYLASPQGDGISGRIISAVWDPWETLADQKERLQNTDIYTLRRILPSDRGVHQ